MNGVNPSISTSNAGFRFSKPGATSMWVRRAVCAVTHLKRSRETFGADLIRERPEAGYAKKALTRPDDRRCWSVVDQLRVDHASQLLEHVADSDASFSRRVSGLSVRNSNPPAFSRWLFSKQPSRACGASGAALSRRWSTRMSRKTRELCPLDLRKETRHKGQRVKKPWRGGNRRRRSRRRSGTSCGSPTGGSKGRRTTSHHEPPGAHSYRHRYRATLNRRWAPPGRLCDSSPRPTPTRCQPCRKGRRGSRRKTRPRRSVYYPPGSRSHCT